MDNIIECGKCGQTLRIPIDAIGRRVMCPSCNTAFTASEAEENPECQNAAEADRAINQASQSATSTSSQSSDAFTAGERTFRQDLKSLRSSFPQACKDLFKKVRTLRVSVIRKVKHIVSNFDDYVVPLFGLFLAVMLILHFTGLGKMLFPPSKGPKPYASDHTSSSPPHVVGYKRKAIAQNGQPWPVSSGYVGGYPQLCNSGLSTVTVDNTANASDACVKLVSLDGPKACPVRTFFISGHSKFTLSGVTSGSYDIRYRDLDTGNLCRSENFNLKETRTYDGVRSSEMTLTLYKVPNGNMQSYSLGEDEF